VPDVRYGIADSSTRLNTIPSFVVIDDFHPNVDNVREQALRTGYVTGRGSPGNRSVHTFRNPVLKAAFESIIGKTITKWDYDINGVFQWCAAGDKLVVHADKQDWAGAWYLTPNAPPEAGTRFYRSKETGARKGNMPNDVAIRTFRGKHLDLTAWEMTDQVGNFYNRLVLWRGDAIHAAGPYFGQEAGNARLFQVFFFDVA
jgi:hypothetical protein